MIGARRILTLATAGIVSTVAVGLMLLPDPPSRPHHATPSANDLSALSVPGLGGSLGPVSDFGAAVPAESTMLPVRPIYRHSVVPGGVYSRAEAEDAAFRRPDVANHYRRVDFPRLRRMEMPRERLYYASYRRDNSIYWTSYPLRVGAKETVLDDGVNLIRARCGNLLSEEPLEPRLPPPYEPLAQEMDSVDVVPLPVIDTAISPPGFWVVFLPIVPAIIFPGGGSHGDHTDPGPTVPEPSPVRLIGLGLAAVVAARYLAGRRARPTRE